ncbi:hypothetical protein WJX73_001430 [Symbiochloris irregularis]|uniref:Growth arrest-specific protein 8 domain-containing protein n=1 Tax=Symbiochloris irregularis TaxID=706552 RepID=A0AAW1NZY9_9CHLO
MPPKASAKGGDKKKAGGKGKAAASAAEPASNDAAAQLGTVKSQLDQEQGDRSLMQLERDKLQQFWDVSKTQVDDLQAELRQRDREAEEQTERHEVELKTFKQKIKHLMYEHGNHIESLRAEAEAAAKEAAEEFHAREMQLMSDKRALQIQLREQEADFQAEAQSSLLDSGKRESKLRAELVAEAAGLSAKHERQLASVREAASLQSKQEQHAIEERLHAHVQALQQQHDKAFMEMRSYFNGVVRDNLEAIMALKAELSEQKKAEAATNAMLQDVVAENQRLVEPLAQARKELADLHKTAALHTQEAASLSLARRRLAEAETRADRLQFENEVWQQRFDLEHREKETLQHRFDATVSGLQQSAVATGLLLDSMQAGKGTSGGMGGYDAEENAPLGAEQGIGAHWSRDSMRPKRASHRPIKSSAGWLSPEVSKQRAMTGESAGLVPGSSDLSVQGIRPPIAGVVQ